MHQPKYYKILVTIFAVGIVLFGHAIAAEAKTATKPKVKKTPHQYLRIFYYQPSTKAFDSFAKHISSVDVIAPQTYSIDSTGALKGAVNPDLLALAKQHKVKVMPLIVNEKFSRSGAQAFLDNQAAQNDAITALVNEAVDNGYWGWQVDFEQMDVAYADEFSSFVKRFGDAMKQNHLASSVAVIAKISDNPDDYPTGSWENVVGVYDYPSLVASTDFLSLMSYDDPGSTGPIARYDWLKQVIAYATSTAPASKLSLGIPFYYWQWNTTTGKHVGTGGYEGIKNTLLKHYVVRGYSVAEQAPYIKYKSKGKHYIIWYENARSVKKKVALVTQNLLHGFSAWSIGLESPDVFQSVKL